MSNVISSQFFKARKLKSVHFSIITGFCFAVFIVLMTKAFGDNEQAPITGMSMFDALSQSFIYLFLVVFANNILSADWTSSSVKQILGKGTNRVKYCIGSMIVAGILTFIYAVFMQGTGFLFGCVLGNGVGAVLDNFWLIFVGYLLIAFNFVSIIMFLYCFIKKSAAVIMIVSFLPIVSDLTASILLATTNNENVAFVSYFKLMEDVIHLNPDSTQSVISYIILGAITIIFAAASVLTFRKEDIN